jgi:hypothetical protein
MGRAFRVFVVVTLLVSGVAACGDKRKKGKRYSSSTVSKTRDTSDDYESSRAYQPSSTPTPTRSAAPACRAGDLTFRLGRPEGTSGNSTADLVVTANGRTCTLSGYPTLTLLDGTRERKTTVRRQSSSAQRTVRLTSGRSATALLGWNGIGSGGAECTPRPTALRIALAGNSGTATVPWPTGAVGSVCDATIVAGPFR